MGDVEVRIAAAGDLDGIADGFARVTGGDAARLRRAVAHALHDNPHGGSSIVAVEPGGRVVGHLGVTHVPMRVKGEPHVFGRFHACFVDPARRSEGAPELFRAMDECFQEAFEHREHLAAVFGQWAEADWWYLRHARGFDAVATSIDLRRPADLPAPGPAEGGIVITHRHDRSAPLATLDVGPCGVLRDGWFDAWRASARGGSERAWHAWRGGALAGVAITRDVDGERLILDWATARGDAPTAHALLRALVGAASSPVRARFWTSDLPTLLQFQDTGFSVEAGPETYLAVRTVLPHVNHLWLSDHWTVTLADAGVRPLPRFTVGETIAYPTAPGALADGDGD